ncbi:MAG TPA: MEDS domain-containing protein [Vicinamibacterales bacterium]|nr:MEDS domain-containing protein [Vicinamibacterales bacterium]
MHWKPPETASEHTVQLFDSSKSLADSVSQFLINGLERGENVLLVATPEHRELLTRRLADFGWSVRTLVAANRMLVCDAAQTLDKFMRQDTPSPVAFDEVVGSIVHRLAAGKRLWIYGEMVDVLAARANYKAAQQLEEIWNVLGQRECFTLFCGYASGHFGDPRTAKALAAICATHDHVHRKPTDILAEFLLNQQDVKAPASR